MTMLISPTPGPYDWAGGLEGAVEMQNSKEEQGTM